MKPPSIFAKLIPAATKKAELSELMSVISRGDLACVFQPIVNLRTGKITGHEALVRGPKVSTLHSAKSLLATAKHEDQAVNFELACLDTVLGEWVRELRVGDLYLNISAASLVHLAQGGERSALIQALRNYGAQVQRVVLEVTEHHHYEAIDLLRSATNAMRAQGLRIALDDLKATKHSIHMWSELLPSIVKLAPSVTAGMAQDPEKERAAYALAHRARKWSCTLIAKGVETAADLESLRECGIDFAQGFFLGSPDDVPIEVLNFRALRALADG